MPGRIAKDWDQEMRHPRYLRAGDSLYSAIGATIPPENKIDALIQQAIASQQDGR